MTYLQWNVLLDRSKFAIETNHSSFGRSNKCNNADITIRVVLFTVVIWVRGGGWLWGEDLRASDVP